MKQALVWITVAALSVPPGLCGQGRAGERGGLRIYVLQGEGAVNNTKTGVAGAPLVEVRDTNDFPVAGAEVTFTTPAAGASATFEGGKHEYKNITDARGQVSAGPMTPAGGEGVFSIHVAAKFGERQGVVSIRQRNSRNEFEPGGPPARIRSGFWGRHKWLLAGAAAGLGAGLGFYFAARDTASGAVLKPGTVVIGGPR